MRTNLFLSGLTAAILLSGCTQADAAEGISLADAGTAPGQIFPQRLSEIRRNCSFPADRNPPLLDEFGSEWYSKHLVASGEASLVSIAKAAPEGELQLRFTWLRSFDPPAVIRIGADPRGQLTLTAKLLSGAGGYEPGEITQQINRPLDSIEERRIMDFVRASRLLEEPAATCDLGLDGAQWIVEVVRNDTYYFIDRWSPDRGAVRELGLLMLSMTGWPIKPEDVY